MKVSYDLIIESGEEELDMEYGLETLAGTAEVTCILAEAILRKRIIRRRSHVNPARAVLKKNFTGSYGQNFDIVIHEPELISELKRMTRSVFSEVMGYFMLEAMYLRARQVSPEATAIINDLSDIADELIDRIRAPLIRMHKINLQKNYEIELNYKKPADKENIIRLTETTASNLTDSKVIGQRFDIRAMITRFNARTGTGRLVLEGENDTIAFGFSSPLRDIPANQKSNVSLNLHTNNGLNDNYTYLTLNVSQVVGFGDVIVKYLIHSVK
jgi:plasmid maintenance system antidote protein VapI